MMNKVMICPNCGKELDGDQMRFCPFCGTEQVFPAAAELGTVAEVRERYEEYAAWARSARSQKEFGRILSTLFTGNRAFKNSPEHERFVMDVKNMAEKLVARYEAGEQRDTLMELLHYVLLDCYKDIAQETEWMYLVAEKFFMPLLALLTQEEAAELYVPYKSLRKKQPGLEFQKNIRKMLKQAANA